VERDGFLDDTVPDTAYSEWVLVPIGTKEYAALSDQGQRKRPGQDDLGEEVTVVEDLAADERPLRAPFWSFTEPGEERTVDRVLRRRFPDAYSRLAAALEEADPMDVVYPGNPGEYHDVVREILVLLAGRDGSIDGLSVDELTGLIEDGLARASANRPTAGPFAGWRNYCPPSTEPQTLSTRCAACRWAGAGSFPTMIKRIQSSVRQ
jgi:hypothetical protein